MVRFWILKLKRRDARGLVFRDTSHNGTDNRRPVEVLDLQEYTLQKEHARLCFRMQG